MTAKKKTKTVLNGMYPAHVVVVCDDEGVSEGVPGCYPFPANGDGKIKELYQTTLIIQQYLGFLFSREVMRDLASSVSLPHTAGFTFNSACQKIAITELMQSATHYRK